MTICVQRNFNRILAATHLANVKFVTYLMCCVQLTILEQHTNLLPFV